MKTNKADIDVVKSKLNDIVELWCVLNTYKGDPRALKIMGLISEFIHKEVLLKRWNELHPLKKERLLSRDYYHKNYGKICIVRAHIYQGRN